MRRILSILIVVASFAGVIFAQGISHRNVAEEQVAFANVQSEASASVEQPRKRKVDFMADLVKPYNNGRDSVVYFIGNFAAHHNGAVIWCDSAVRYSDTKWGFFHRMVINQDSIFIYGDSAIYDGEATHAEIYAPIVKVVDGDAMLYTYNFSFNTDTKVGQYVGGGVLVHDDNILESQRGYYDAENHNIICVEQVELHGQDYDMKSDSIIYNTDTEFARFFTSSEIWDADGEYLSADEGYYDKANDLYKITRNGYILSQEQEMWSDTMEYHRSVEHIIARSNIQMDDFKNKIMAFGDYAEYWSEDGKALLTSRPAAIGYDTSQSDSVFMRSDSLWLITVDPQKEAAAQEELMRQMRMSTTAGVDLTQLDPGQSMQDALFGSNNVMQEEQSANDGGEARGAMGIADRGISARGQARRERTNTTEAGVEDNNGGQGGEEMVDDGSDDIVANDVDENGDEMADEVVEQVDSVQLQLQDSLAKLSPKQLKEYHAAQAKEQARLQKEQQKREQMRERKIKLDSIAKVRQAKITEMLEKERAREMERQTKDSIHRAERRAKLVAKGKDVSLIDKEDSIAKMRNERIRNQMADSSKTVADSIPQVKIDGEQQQEVKAQDSVKVDSVYRLIKAYRNVKMYRSDAQMVCDSLVSNSKDSIIHLYIEPVMWNQSNQLASEKVDIYTANGELSRAEFSGNPIMIAEIDTVYYNQVAGKSMVAHFKDNEVCRNDVDGNVQTIYFRTESEDSPLVIEMTYLESASASFYIEKQQLVGITYRNDVPFTMYPLALIPDTQPTKLDNFKWVPELRPTREGVFDRVIRPTEREERWGRLRPAFNIVQNMDRRKEQLLMTGAWSDREDQLTPELIEWRNRNMEK